MMILVLDCYFIELIGSFSLMIFGRNLGIQASSSCLSMMLGGKLRSVVLSGWSYLLFNLLPSPLIIL
jgi:serine protease inhibitor ecotin